MHSRQVCFAIAAMAAAAVIGTPVVALEITTQSNDRASNAALVRHLAAQRVDQLAEIAAIEAQVDAMLICTAKGKFHTPSHTDADSDGCTSISVTVN